MPGWVEVSVGIRVVVGMGVRVGVPLTLTRSPTEDEERPVHQPAALLQLHDGGRGRARLDRVAQRLVRGRARLRVRVEGEGEAVEDNPTLTQPTPGPTLP